MSEESLIKEKSVDKRLKGGISKEEYLEMHKMKRVSSNRDIMIKKNKIATSKYIPSHLKIYVHSLKTGF
jgi:hypothetical protein